MGIQINNKQVLDMNYLGKKAYSAVLNGDYVFASTLKKVSGVLQNIKDAAALPINKLYLEGNSYQETTSGVSLIDWSKSTNNVGTFENDVLTVTTTGAWKGRAYDILAIVKNNPGKRIYFSCESFSMTSVSHVQINWTQSGTEKYNGLMSYTGSRNSLLIPEDTSEITKATLIIYSNNSSNTTTEYTTIITKPMLYFGEIGNQQEYEPYTNGPSPNPDYPQEVEVIEGSVDVDVVGKNLFDKDNANILNGYISSGSINTYSNRSVYIPVIQGETYTIQKFVGGVGLRYCFTTDTPKIGSQTTLDYVDNTGFVSTVTAPTNGNYLCITIYRDGDTSYTLEEVLSGLQIEKDSTATEYEPHKSTTASLDLQDNFIAKIGDVCDEIDVVTGKLTKRIGKVVLDGSENWTKSSIDGLTRFASQEINGAINSPNRSIMLSNYFKYISSGNVIGGGFIYNQQFFAYPNQDIKTVADFKTWLASNNVEVYYILAEPYEVQLDITKIPLFEGINNVKVTTNLDPSLTELDYYIR